jgi:hypothetical protein
MNVATTLSLIIVNARFVVQLMENKGQLFKIDVFPAVFH